ncbi:TPA: hypothetical protein U2C09_001077 [Streptococcus suis]|uniref:hypothetical protein n=1 Tax=Streptococcus pluranimalium TaxID=82348 RepID=UPI00292E3D2D|nr:hypothetical protein [Streptococcus pluranimalium]HEM6116497.1 hypothetical protein [Streptococcus suis]
MARDIFEDLAWENVIKAISDNDWRLEDEVVFVSLANQQDIEDDERFVRTDHALYFGNRVCIFSDQIKKNRYLTLHKNYLEKIIEALGQFPKTE